MERNVRPTAKSKAAQLTYLNTHVRI